MKSLKTNTYLQQSSFFMDVLALIAGALLPLAFAPINLFFLAFACPLLLLIVLRKTTPKRAFWRGWLFGLGNFAVGASWIYVSIHTFGNTSFILAAIITLGFVALLALFYGVMSYVYTWLFARNSWLNLCIAFPCCWVLQEILRSWFLTGFPWLLIGNTQIDTFLAPYAPLISVYGVSFLVICCNSLLLIACGKRRYSWLSLVIILGIFGIGSGLGTINWSHPTHKPLTVSLIQGNVSQHMKWNPAYLHISLQRYQQLTNANINSNLIVWPEGAVPDLLNDQRTFLSKIDDAAKAHHTAVISGIPISNKSGQYFNGAITLGDAYGVYLKRHLVPFGEYVPLENLLRGLIGFFDLPMSNFTAGPDNQSLLQVNGISIAPYLCYEIAYLNLVLHDAPQAELLLNMSDDSWFGDSWAAAQQLQIAQMRSLETAREQMVVANSGYTAIINNKGEITAIAPKDNIEVLHGVVQARQGNTPLVNIGWVIELLVLLAITALCIIISRKRQ